MQFSTSFINFFVWLSIYLAITEDSSSKSYSGYVDYDDYGDYGYGFTGNGQVNIM
jgi:hypothetical protein